MNDIRCICVCINSSIFSKKQNYYLKQKQKNVDKVNLIKTVETVEQSKDCDKKKSMKEQGQSKQKKLKVYQIGIKNFEWL